MLIMSRLSVTTIALFVTRCLCPQCLTKIYDQAQTSELRAFFGEVPCKWFWSTSTTSLMVPLLQVVFTLGLSVSSAVDVLITASLFYYLGMGRTISTT